VRRQDQQVAAAAIVGDGRWLGSLRDEMRTLLAPVFHQARSRLAAFGYVDALLTEPGDRRSCRQLAESAGHATPRRLQALLAEHAWDWKAALAAAQRFILGHLSDPGAVLVLDQTAVSEKGPDDSRGGPPSSPAQTTTHFFGTRPRSNAPLALTSITARQGRIIRGNPTPGQEPEQDSLGVADPGAD
jgi:DDE superfamily endonuclease